MSNVHFRSNPPEAVVPTSARITALDLARFIAILGMVVVHGSTELVMLPLERSNPGGAVSPPREPTWAYVLQLMFVDKARGLFFLLAGIGVSLMMANPARRGPVLAKRAGYLGAMGILLVILGWSDLILVIYGVVFLLAAGIFRRSNGFIGLLSLCFFIIPLVVPSDAGVPYILSQVAFFTVGMLIGRQDLRSRKLEMRTILTGMALLVVGALGKVTGASELTLVDTANRLDVLSSNLLAFGFSFVVLAGCLRFDRAQRVHSRSVRWLVIAGAMPLTLYVGHALFFIPLSRILIVDLAAATYIATLYMIGSVAFAIVWHSWQGRGPLEAFMRRLAPS